MNLRAADGAVLLAYLGLAVWLGSRAGRKDESLDDFFAGGRSLPGWLVGFSILGTCISSVTYVAYPGKAFASDWQYLVQGLMLPVVLVLGGFWVAGVYRRRVKLTVTELLHARFGRGVQLFSVFFLICSELARIGSVLYLFGLVVKAATGFPLNAVIIGIGLATVLYATLGGIKGVIITDFMQSVLLVLGGVVAVAFASAGVPGGVVEIFHEAREMGKFRLLDFSGGLNQDTFWVLALSGLVNYFYFLAGNQNQVQRYQCAASDREARKALLIGSLGSVPVWALFMLTGTSLFVFYKHQAPELQAAAFSMKPDEVFPFFIVNALPLGFSGLLLAGLVSAAMSSLDSSMNACATLFMNDIYGPRGRGAEGGEKALAAARWLTFVFGAGGIGIALAMTRVEVFLDFYFKLVSLVIGCLTGVVFLALVSKRAHARGVMLGLGAGLIISLWGLIDMAGLLRGRLQGFGFPWHPIMAGVAAALMVVLVGGLGSAFLPGKLRPSD